ncbi:MAG: glycosyltransferase family 4 protein [Candidatus Sumerlaeota bacterium]|nr:glycosyltransferase family 4 protein [Candidatus Sumerlaeota bacterium]
MRLLFTNFLQGWGGQSARILTECLLMREHGHEVMISAPPGSQLVARARACGLIATEEVAYAGGLRWRTVRDAISMRRLIKRFQPDIIHVNGGRDSWLVATVLCWRRGRPRIARSKHNMYPIKPHFFNWWLYGRFFDRIVCVSSSVRQLCESTGFIPTQRLCTIFGAADCTPFDQAQGLRNDMRREFGYDDSHIVIAMTGRFRPEKGHGVLLDAAPMIFKAIPAARILIIGSGSLLGQIKTRIRSEGLHDHIKLAGFRTDIAACLSAADIFVQPSIMEGLSVSLLEACAARLPITASRTGGMPDVINDGANGILTEPGSAKELATTAIKLANDPALRNRLGSAARQTVEERFSMTAMAHKLDAMYQSMVR